LISLLCASYGKLPVIAALGLSSSSYYRLRFAYVSNSTLEVLNRDNVKHIKLRFTANQSNQTLLDHFQSIAVNFAHDQHWITRSAPLVPVQVPVYVSQVTESIGFEMYRAQNEGVSVKCRRAYGDLFRTYFVYAFLLNLFIKMMCVVND
jgi:hypothetical protein